MFNLLLRSDKIFLFKEYRFRVVIIALWLVASTLFIASILLIPSYIWSKAAVDGARVELQAVQTAQGTEADTPAQKTLLDAKQQIDTLSPTPNENVGDITSRIISAKGSGIRLSDISYVYGANGASAMQISGNASSRESLVTFSHALEALPEFTSVDVPISNFVKSTNIEFSINLVLK